MKRLQTLVLSLAAITAQAQTYYEKTVTFPTAATTEQKVEMAARLVPTKQQLAWQQMELTAFLHYGINTFTGREWGDGKEDPKLFKPSGQDCDQWVRTLKAAGFKMALITAKHHDGFCLWQTKTTKHSVASSAWKEGKGDVVKELRDACQKYGLKFGVYLSPWDRNAECYGEGEAYNDFFIKQLTELLTNYGEVHEVWFDGANGEGPNGKKQEYDWARILETIHRLQPQAVTAIMGDDVRWVGNERGLGRETEWSSTVLTPDSYSKTDLQNDELNIRCTSDDLGSRHMIARATNMYWYPSEVDVSIRPGWFYHADQDTQVKSLKHLTDIYFKSVGYNSVLLLNIPPDCTGQINAADSTRLIEFANYRNSVFSKNNIQKGTKAWTARIGDTKEYKLRKNAIINTLMLCEDIARGQRIEAFTVEALVKGQWIALSKGTTVGYKRLLRITAIQAEAIRIKITNSRGVANLIAVGAYYAPSLEAPKPEPIRNDIPRSEWNVIANAPFTIDLKKSVSLNGFIYAPTNGEVSPSIAYHYIFSVSQDGNVWKEVKTTGEFSNIMNNPIPQTVTFTTSVKARYLKIEAKTADDKVATITTNEFGIIAE
ncbi:MAG: alpha-L-fucosidase [Bacteroidaceae bacterium]